MAVAQQTLSGTISDDKNKPLAGVSILAPELHKGTVSDADGKYELRNLPKANIDLTFSFSGYKTENVVTTVDGPTVFNLVMTESVHEMDEVIISTAFNKIQSQNVVKVDHVATAAIMQKGAATLAEGLATIPGVSQVSTGTSIGKPVIRGLGGNRVLVYAQGVRMENQQFGDEHGLGLSDSGVESVEVIKGPASLLYGSDAMGGVLYFNPEKFADAQTTHADFTQKFFSNTLGSVTGLGAKTSGDYWKFLARGQYATHSDYAVPVGDRVTNTRFNESDAKIAVGYSGAQLSSVVRYNFNRLDIGIPEEGIGRQSESKNTLFPRQGVDNHTLSVRNQLFFGKSTLESTIGYSRNNRKEFEDSDAAVLDMALTTFSYDVKYHSPKSENWAAIAGVQGMSQINRNAGEERLIPDAAVDDFGIFATVSRHFGRSALQAGARYDNRKIKTEAFGDPNEEGNFAALDRSFDSFNLSLGHKIDLGNWRLRVNVATGFRSPNLAELSSNGVHEGTNRYEIGNAGLKTEQNIQFDLNIEYKASHIEWFANGFYNRIGRYIFIAPTGDAIDENPVFAYAQDDAALFGGEAGLHFHPHPLDWLHFESSFETVSGRRDDGKNLPLIPAGNWTNAIRAEYKIGQWLTEGYGRIEVSSTFGQPAVSDFETETAGYTLVGASVGAKIALGKTDLDVTLTGTNLCNKRYIAHLSRLKPDGIPNMGRNFVLGLTVAL
jgi:iron complex outermembrane receptor protein